MVDNVYNSDNLDKSAYKEFNTHLQASQQFNFAMDSKMGAIFSSWRHYLGKLVLLVPATAMPL